MKIIAFITVNFLIFNRLFAQCENTLNLIFVEKVCAKDSLCDFESFKTKHDEIISKLEEGKYLVFYFSKKILSGSTSNKYENITKSTGCELVTNDVDLNKINEIYFTDQINASTQSYYELADGNTGFIFVLRSYENEFKDKTLSKFFKTELKCKNTQINVISINSGIIDIEEQFKQIYSMVDMIGLGGILDLDLKENKKRIQFTLYSHNKMNKSTDDFMFINYPKENIKLVNY